jgi:HK97 gp10 family phage protein
MAELRRVTGLSQLARALQELPLNLQRNGLRKAVARGAMLVRNDARARAPVKTGEMRRNILIKRARTPDAQIATYEVFVRSGKKARLAKGAKKRDVHSDPFYWRFVEFGTSKMAARPFLRPAFEATKYDAVDEIERVLREKLAEFTR